MDFREFLRRAQHLGQLVQQQLVDVLAGHGLMFPHQRHDHVVVLLAVKTPVAIVLRLLACHRCHAARHQQIGVYVRIESGTMNLDRNSSGQNLRQSGR